MANAIGNRTFPDFTSILYLLFDLKKSTDQTGDAPLGGSSNSHDLGMSEKVPTKFEVNKSVTLKEPKLKHLLRNFAL